MCAYSVSQIHRKVSGEVTNECLIISLYSSCHGLDKLWKWNVGVFV